MYHALGLSDRITVTDRQGRPLSLLEERAPLPRFG
jgi:hypothetical protein